LYREHGTKKPFCDSIFDLKEQLIALQLVMAQLNKEVQKLFHNWSPLRKNSAWKVLFLSQRLEKTQTLKGRKRKRKGRKWNDISLAERRFSIKLACKHKPINNY